MDRGALQDAHRRRSGALGAAEQRQRRVLKADDHAGARKAAPPRGGRPKAPPQQMVPVLAQVRWNEALWNQGDRTQDPTSLQLQRRDPKPTYAEPSRGTRIVRRPGYTKACGVC